MPSDDSEALVERQHYESIFITDLQRDLGKAKAIMTDAGYEGEGPLQELLDGFVGHKMVAGIRHSKNKNDPESPYVNLDLKKIGPVGEVA